MDEYVTKEKVLAQLERCARDPYHESHYIRDAAVNTIRRMEAADVAPVRHGRWEKNDDLVIDTLYRCSVCGEEFYLENGTPQENQYYYCPNCGARMDGEDDEIN